MGLLTSFFSGEMMASTPGPTDDWWYKDVSALTAAGLHIDAEGAKKISAWYRGREILATSMAMIPFGMYQKLPDDQGRDAYPEHPLHDVIHRKPNGWQDSFQWRRQLMYHLIDHGNAYCRIVGGRRGFVEQLRPFQNPTRVKPRLTDGRKHYAVKQDDGTSLAYTQDDIYHLCGASEDGIEGKGILQYARDSIGLGRALDSYASRLFSQGVLHGGTIVVPGTLNPEASKRMAESFVTSQSNWHMPKVLEQGAEYTEATLTPENAQFILSRKFTVNDIARWLGLPPHMLADLERSTNNNIEWQGQEFVTYALGMWLALFEFATNDQLIVSPNRYYSEFTRDALARGDLATRWEAYMKAVTTGVYTRNEIRIMENKKKLPGLDEPLDPQNITGKPGAEGEKKPGSGTKPGGRPTVSSGSKAEAIAVAAAQRLLITEVAFVQKTAVAHADDQDAFAEAITDFYAKHAGFVCRSLLLPLDAARAYCARQAKQVAQRGVARRVAETWKTEDYAQGLAALALDVEDVA